MKNSRFYKAGDLVRSVNDETQIRSEHFGAFRGVRTGIISFDRVAESLFDSSSLTLVAGPSGGGKTVFAAQFAVAAAAQCPTLWMSLEDDPRDVVRRVVANVGRVDVSSMRRGFESGNLPEEARKAETYLDDLPLEICDTGGTAVDVLRTLLEWIERNEIDRYSPMPGVVVIDQLSHILPPTDECRKFWKERPEFEIQAPGRGAADHAVLEYQAAAIRSVGAYFGLTIVLLHQTNQQRNANGGVDRSSVRGSQGLVQKADAVLLIQDILEEEPFPGSFSHGSKPELRKTEFAKFVCEKARRGVAGWSIKLWFDGSRQRWADTEEKTSGVGEYMAPAGLNGKAVAASAALRKFLQSDTLTPIASPSASRQIAAAPPAADDYDGFDPNEAEAREGWS